MKTTKYILIAAAAFAAMACVQEENPVNDGTQDAELVQMTFTASAEEDTKVFYDGNTKTTQWKAGDKIMVISSTGTAIEFEATAVSANGMSATFVGWHEADKTYYAVYPASAYKGNDLNAPTNPRLYVEIPAEQTAVAGSFDPDALVMTATNSGAHLSFKNLCSVIRFNLANPEGVQSVKFTMNGNTNLAGNENVYINNLTSHSWGDAFDGRYSKNMITLNAPAEGFVAETDYYFTLRPYTQRSNDADANKGVNIYVVGEDGVKVRSGASEFIAAKNTIKSLGTIDPEGKMTALTPYECYNLGFDINIAGKIINKANYSAASLIQDDSQISSAGVYFITEGAENVSIPATIFDKDTYIIGNGAERSTIILTGTVQWNANILAFKNISFTDSHTGDLMKPNAANGTALFDNCALTTDSEKSQIIYSGTTLTKLAFHNCDIKVTDKSKQLLKMHNNGIVTDFELVNNIFYPTKEAGHQNFNVCLYGTITNLKYSHNTMAEVYQILNGSANNTYQYFAGVTSITYIQFTNNLYYLTKYSESTYANGSYTSIIKATTYPTSGTVTDNVIHWTSTNSRLKIADENLSFGQNTCSSQTVASELVDINKTNITNGVIVPNNKYGATR